MFSFIHQPITHVLERMLVAKCCRPRSADQTSVSDCPHFSGVHRQRHTKYIVIELFNVAKLLDFYCSSVRRDGLGCWIVVVNIGSYLSDYSSEPRIIRIWTFNSNTQLIRPVLTLSTWSFSHLILHFKLNATSEPLVLCVCVCECVI